MSPLAVQAVERRVGRRESVAQDQEPVPLVPGAVQAVDLAAVDYLADSVDP